MSLEPLLARLRENDEQCVAPERDAPLLVGLEDSARLVGPLDAPCGQCTVSVHVGGKADLANAGLQVTLRLRLLKESLAGDGGGGLRRAVYNSVDGVEERGGELARNAAHALGA